VSPAAPAFPAVPALLGAPGLPTSLPTGTLALGFATPALLWLLALLPLLAAAYLLSQRRRARYAARFTNLDLLASVVTRSPGWRRHVPPVAYLLAMASLLLAVAHPTVTRPVAVQEATVMLLVDVSGSMISTDVQPSRIAAAQSAATTFVNELPHALRVGLVAFSSEARLLAVPTTDHSSVRRAIGSLQALGATAMGNAIDLGVEAAASTATTRAGAKAPPTVILLLSDGKNTVGRPPIDAADSAAQAGVKIFTVALGTPDGMAAIPDANGVVAYIPVPPDPDTLQAVADRTKGRFFPAPTAGQLKSVYANLGSQLGQKPKKKDVTAWFAGAAAVLLVLGGGLALAWFSRFP